MPRRLLIGCVAVGCVGLVAGIASWFMPRAGRPQDHATSESLLPFRDLFTASEVAAQFERKKIDRVPDQKLAFQIDIPRSWELRRPMGLASPSDTERLAPLATFLTEDEDAIIEVQYMRVPEKVGVDLFLDTYVVSANYRVLQRQHDTFNRREVADALLEKEGDLLGAVYTRLTVSRRGEFVVVVASSSPKSSYDQYKRIFGLAAVSFETPDS